MAARHPLGKLPATRRRFLAGLAALTTAPAAVAPAWAQDAVAPDVVLYAEPTLRPLLVGIAAAWRRETRVRVVLLSSPTWAMLQQIDHRARADLIIGAGDAEAEAAAQRHIVKADSCARLWRNRLVVAARTDAGSLAGDAAQRIGAGPIAVCDPLPGSAGEASRQALAALGLWPALAKNTVGVASTADAAFLLRQGKVERAVLYATDVSATPAFTVAAALPEDAYAPVNYWLAIADNVISPRSDDLARYLRQPAAQERARAAGLEVL